MPGGLGQVQILDHDEHPLGGEDPPDAGQVRHGYGGVGAGDPQQPDGALFGVPEDLHRMRGRRPVRDDNLVDVPQGGEFGDVARVLPVAEAGQIAVGAALAVVLRGGLAVHLQDPAARAAEHAAQQVQVVHLAGRRGRLVGLVEALQHGGQDPVAGAEDLGGAPHVTRGHPAHVGDGIRGPRVHHGPQLVDVEGVRADVVVVRPVVLEQLPDQPVHQREVGAGADGQVHSRMPGDGRCPRVDTDQRRWRRAGEPVQNPGPQHRLGLGHVVAEEEQGIARIDVGVGAGLPVAAEGLLHRGGRGGRAQPGVAVHVGGADSGLAEHGQRVVLLQEQLPAGVEAVRQRAAVRQKGATVAIGSPDRPASRGAGPAGRPPQARGAVAAGAPGPWITSRSAGGVRVCWRLTGLESGCASPGVTGRSPRRCARGPRSSRDEPRIGPVSAGDQDGTEEQRWALPSSSMPRWPASTTPT